MCLDLYSVNVDLKVLEDIEKYKQIGTVKKQLYSMPQYYREREQKGIKLPANKIKPSTDKDVIKVRGDEMPLTSNFFLNVQFIADNETRMGRVVAQEIAEIKKMENLKQKLSPLHYRPKSV